MRWWGGDGKRGLHTELFGWMKYNFNVEDVAALRETNKGLNEGKVCLCTEEEMAKISLKKLIINRTLKGT